MTYLEFKPQWPLSEFVQLIWVWEDATNVHHLPRERIVPDGIVELVFHFGDPLVTYFPDDTASIQPLNFVIAQVEEFIEIEAQGPIGLISVRFFPWGAYHFLNVPIKELKDRIIPAELIWNDAVLVLQDKICCASNNTTRINLVQDFLLHQLRKNFVEYPDLDDIVKYIAHTHGRTPIERLTREIGMSQRNLERKFIHSVGISPKQFSRIHRFLGACSGLKRADYSSLTDFTYDMGYYDQSHFIRDFKAFSGMNPTEFLNKDHISFLELK